MVKHREYISCLTRMRSFSSEFLEFRQQHVHEVARIGFFSAGYKDYVRCYSCGVLVTDWNVQDLETNHRNKSPNCQHLINLQNGNLDEENNVISLNNDEYFSDNVSFPVIQDQEVFLDAQNNATWLTSDVQETESVVGSLSTDFQEKLTVISHEANQDYIRQLEREMENLRTTLICKVCMDNTVNMVLIPCGHLSTCQQCTSSLINCPQCRAGISATQRTFI